MILYIFGAKLHFKVMISLAFCLQSNGFVHIWHQKHYKVMISLAFAFKVTVFVHMWCQMHFKVTIS